MLRIGLTGGIASGKTALGNELARRGLTVIDADAVSHALMQPGEPGYRAAIEHFGEAILDPEGRIGRAALRRRVFEHPEERRWLEAMLHPLIRRRIEQTLDALDEDRVIVIVPLLFESGFDELVDLSLAIDCPRAVQLQRLTARDGIDRTLAERMIDAQLGNRERLQKADFGIRNDGSEPVGQVADRVIGLIRNPPPLASR